jgi:SAM-dependent methyltransferase
VLDFLPENLRHRFRIEDAEDISAHQYDEVAMDLVEDVRRRGGKVLDCGSGMRPRVDEAVVCLEVAPFPSVDVLAVNQRLPFRSAAFEAVLSLNVLEHVTDPFACAAELVRVLKPGGRLYCCIPFLQPEHGYPHHYFNATRSGLRQLFPENFEVLQHVVPRSGEPLWTLHWFLSWYAAGLPEEKKQRFLQLRVKDIIDKPPLSVLNEPWVVDLSEQSKWKLASTTAAVFRKPS